MPIMGHILTGRPSTAHVQVAPPEGWLGFGDASVGMPVAERVTHFNHRGEPAVGWPSRHCLQGKEWHVGQAGALRASKLHNAKCLHLRSSAVVRFFDC